MRRGDLSMRRNAHLRGFSGIHISEDDKTPHQLATELKEEIVRRIVEAAKRRPTGFDEEEEAEEEGF